MTFSIGGVSYGDITAVKFLEYTIDERGASTRVTADGLEHHAVAARKVRFTRRFLPTTRARAVALCQAINGGYITVTYDDPMTGSTTSKTMRADKPAKLTLALSNYAGDVQWWQVGDVEFVER